MIVVDASSIVDLLLNSQRAKAISHRLFRSRETIHAPYLLDVEVIQVLRRFALSGELHEERAAEAVEDFLDLPIERYPHDLLLPRIWELRENLTAYDATYVALAEVLAAPLLTSDLRLARSSAARHLVEVIAAEA